MKNSIHLYLDEDVHSILAPVLREKGFDVISTTEAGNKGKSDNDQLEYAITEQRTILTFNSKDYITLYNDFYTKNKMHYGIIVSSQLNFKDTYRCVIK